MSIALGKSHLCGLLSLQVRIIEPLNASQKSHTLQYVLKQPSKYLISMAALIHMEIRFFPNAILSGNRNTLSHPEEMGVFYMTFIAGSMLSTTRYSKEVVCFPCKL
jgi:hypothetical protein